ncbi:MAG: hypothetical protein AAGE89_04760 [Pseudomonadota bacterium]
MKRLNLVFAMAPVIATAAFFHALIPINIGGFERAQQSQISNRVRAIRFTRNRSYDETPVQFKLHARRLIGFEWNERPFWYGPGERVRKGIFKSGSWTLALAPVFVGSTAGTDDSLAINHIGEPRVIILSMMFDPQTGAVLPGKKALEDDDLASGVLTVTLKNRRQQNVNGNRDRESHRNLCDTILAKHRHDVENGRPTDKRFYRHRTLYMGWPVEFSIPKTALDPEGGSFRRDCQSLIRFFDEVTVDVTDMRNLTTLGSPEKAPIIYN